MTLPCRMGACMIRGLVPMVLALSPVLAALSTSAAAATIPSAPQNLQSSAGSGQNYLGWNAPSSNGGSTITNYRVFRGTSSSNQTIVTSGGCANLSAVLACTDTGLTNGQIYYYFVSAVNSVGQGPGSNTVTATPIGGGLPSAPSNLTGAGQTSRVLLAWTDNSSNESGFKIERKTGVSGTYAVVGSVGANTPGYVDSAVANGTVYCYRVDAYNGSGNSGYSNEVCATPLAVPVLTAPANGATVTQSSVSLQWNGVTGANGYGVDVGTGSCGTTNIVSNGAAPAPSYTLSNLTNGTYYWRARAVSTAYPGLSDASACRSLTVQLGGGLPSAPSNLTGAGQTSRVLLAWTDNSSNESGFKIERKTGVSGTYAVVGSVGANTPGYVDSAVANGTVYCYRVDAYNGSGNSGYSNEVCATPLAVPVLTAPANGATVTQSSVSLQWNGVTGANGYGVDVGTGSCGTTNIVSNGAAPAPSYTLSNLTNGTYYWRARAVSTAYPGLSDASACRSLTVQLGGGLPSAPSNLTGAGQTSRVLLAWTDNSSNESGFKIERKTGVSGTYAVVGSVGANTPGYVDSAVANGTVYCYRVDAYNGSGNSGYSNEVCATPLAVPVLTAPANGATVTQSSVSLQWNGVTGATLYGVDVGTGSCGATNIVSNGAAPAPSYTLSNLTNGTYYWRARAATATYPGISDASPCRSFIVSTGSLPLPPTLVSPGWTGAPGPSLTPTTPHFSWLSVPGADGYGLYISRYSGGSWSLVFDSTTIGAQLTGTSYNLPSAYQLGSGSQYRWNMNSHGPAGYGSPNIDRLYFTVGPVAPGLITITSSLQYNPVTTALALEARVVDSALGPVIAGSVEWQLRDSGLVVRSSGSMSYDAQGGSWHDSRAITPGLEPGIYSVDFSVTSDRGATGNASQYLQVAGGSVALSGTVSDSSNGATVGGAQVGLFDAASLWNDVNTSHSGVVPSLTQLLVELTPATTVLTTSADGAFQWAGVPWGHSYVIVSAKGGYVQSYTDSFVVSSGSQPIVKTIQLAPVATATLAALGPDVDHIATSGNGVLNYNAGLMTDLSIKAANDVVYGDEQIRDMYSEAAGYVSTAVSFGIADGLQELSKEAFKKAVESAASLTLDAASSQLTATGTSDLLRNTLVGQLTTLNFPTNYDYTAANNHLVWVTKLKDSRDNFFEKAPTVSLNPAFDTTRAHQLINLMASSFNDVRQRRTVFVTPPSDDQPIKLLKLGTMISRYNALANSASASRDMETLLSTVQYVGSATALAVELGTATAGTPLAVGLLGAGEAAGWAKIVVQTTKSTALREMGYTFVTALVGTYPEDDGIVCDAFQNLTDFLKIEANAPNYLNKNYSFSGTASIATDLFRVPFTDWDVAWTFGWAGYPSVAQRSVTVTLDNTGSVESEFRAAAQVQWSAMKLFGIVDLGEGQILESVSQGAVRVPSGGSGQVTLPFTGYGRGLLGTFKPHYLTVQSWSGPWQLQAVTKPFYIVNPGDILTNVLPLMARQGTAQSLKSVVGRPRVAHENDVVASVASSQGRLTVHELMQQVAVGGELGPGVLSASAPSFQRTLVADSGLYALDVRLFAPEDAGVSLVLSDSSGNRLGYSSADGVTYNELVGGVSDIHARPIVLRLLSPQGGATYTITVSLLTPGPDSVGIDVFYEPVKTSTALLGASPSVLVVDGAPGATGVALLQIGEVSSQEALTGVTATLGALQQWTGTKTLPAPPDVVKIVGTLPAGTQTTARWELALPVDAEWGKYVGWATVTTDQTVPLTVPVTVLVRRSTQTVGMLEGTATDSGVVQRTLTLGSSGTAQTWVHIPNGFKVLHAVLGLVGSSSLADPSLDIGGDGTADWSFSGTFDVGVSVANVEDCFNTYLDSHAPGPDGWDVPLVVHGPAAAQIQFNGLQLYLEPPCVAPQAPVLAAPASSGSGLPYTLDWSATSPENSYEIQEADDASFTSASALPLTRTSQVFSHSATNSTTYYYRVRAVETCGGITSTSSWSNVATTVVGCITPGIGALTAFPVLLSPGGASTLAWTTSGVTSVTFNGATVAASGNQVVHPTSTTTYTLLATNGCGSTSQTVTVTVNTGTGGLATPTITAPSAGQALSTGGISFAWGAVAGASGYDLRLFAGSSGSTVFSGSLDGNGSTNALVSLPDGAFTFAVRACSGTPSDATCGRFGSVAFSVSSPAPSDAPTITFPTEGLTLTTSTQNLAWTSVAKIDPSSPMQYQLVLTDITTGLAELQISVFDQTSTIFSLRSSTHYQLKVRACQAGCGAWSVPVDFAVALPAIPTNVPVITNALVAGGNSLSVWWTGVPRADLYQIQVVQPTSGPGGGALTVAAMQVSDTTVTLPIPQGDATIFVWGCTGDGCGPQSAGWDITALGPNPSTPNLGTPLAGSSITGPTVNFSWNRIPGDTGSNTEYRLYVGDNARSRPALDVYTTNNYYAANFKAEGTRYDALVIAKPRTASPVQGPATGFLVRGPSGLSPTMVQPAYGFSVPQGNVQIEWTPLPGASCTSTTSPSG